MRSMLIGAAVAAVLALVGAVAAAPLPPEAQGVVTRYIPQASRSARQVCQQQVDVLYQQRRVFDAMRDDRMSAAAVGALTAAVIMQQAVVDALMRDARVQDPSFQCFRWDFSSAAAGRGR